MILTLLLRSLQKGHYKKTTLFFLRSTLFILFLDAPIALPVSRMTAARSRCSSLTCLRLSHIFLVQRSIILSVSSSGSWSSCSARRAATCSFAGAATFLTSSRSFSGRTSSLPALASSYGPSACSCGGSRRFSSSGAAASLMLVAWVGRS